MSRGLVHRPTRTTVPVERPEPEEISAPPTMTGDNNGTPMQFLLPVIGAMTSVIMMVVLRNGQPLFLVVAAVIFVVAIVGGLAFALSSRGRAVRQARFQRTMYLDYLEKLQGELRERGESARNQALALDPPPEALLGVVRDPARLWERRRTDSDFLAPRVGSATRDWFDLQVAPAGTPIEPADPFMQSEAELVADNRGTVADMPLTASLRDSSVVAIIGARDRTLATARAILAQVAAAHTPDDAPIAAVFGERRASDWRGLDLLPHVQDLGLFDGPVPARRIARDMAGLGGVIGADLADRTQAASAARRRGTGTADLSRLVVVLDEHGGNAASIPVPDASMHPRELGIVQLHLLDSRLQEPADVDVRIELGDDGATLTTQASRPTARSERFAPDQMGEREFHALARQLAAMRTARAAQAEVEDTSSFDVTDLLGIEHVDDIEPEKLWQPRTPSTFLRVPFALDDAGQPVHLDLKESAQQGMGPHGICVGATGSGKSEMLRTLILSLALGHSPEDLSLILVDYKGGAAFAPFQGLPHLAGLIDNLADDPQLTVRARASLQGEVVRRQQLLKDADSSPSITHYRQLREERPELPPMPHLFVVIDEFGELLTAEPDFIDLFLQIGRIGRSIGVHLLLSSQRIEGGKLRGLDTYLSYRLGLRTFSEAESQVVLDTKDAYRLPAVPGYGILKVDTSLYRRFRAGYVSGPVPVDRRPVVEDDEQSHPHVYRLPVYNGITAPGEESAQQAPTLTRPDTGRQLVDEAVDRLRAASEAVRPVWLPPLPDRVALQRVLEGRATQGEFDVAIGLEDDPARQQQNPLVLDLTRGGGNVAIVGSPGSGRSTLLRTVGASLALTRTPQEVAIYGMDLTGGGLRRLEEFPHVGGIATRGDRDRLTRLIEELQAMLAHRERVFREHAVDSIAELRAMHRAGRMPELPAPDIVVLIDGYGALRQDFEELESDFTDIMLRASSFGVHLVMAMTRWNELRMAHQSLFGTKVELHLNEPSDSVIDRKLAQTLADDTPGRVLSEAKTIAQIALPVLELTEDGEIGEALAALAHRSAQSWDGPSAAPIRLLPTELGTDVLPDPVDEPHAVPLGLRQDTMGPTSWDIGGGEQHLLVLGDARSGKSNTLRILVRGLIERYTPDELAIAVVDPRGHVADAVPEEYLAAHAKTPKQAAGLATSIASELAQRPSRPQEEKEREPRIVLLVDDHDIISAGGVEQLGPLMAHLPSARDDKFHMVAARPVAGVARAMYGPLLQGMRDTGGATLLMSGERSEGQVLPRVYPELFPAGRGRYVRRGMRPFVVQVALDPGTATGDS